MNQDLDTRIVPDRPLDDEDCVTLWALHLKQRVSDATCKPVKGLDCVAPTHHEQQEARSWLLNPSMSLAIACAVTGVDMDALNTWAKHRAASNWQLQ